VFFLDNGMLRVLIFRSLRRNQIDGMQPFLPIGSLANGAAIMNQETGLEGQESRCRNDPCRPRGAIVSVVGSIERAGKPVFDAGCLQAHEERVTTR
jgi:hypothetical protein